MGLGGALRRVGQVVAFPVTGSVKAIRAVRTGAQQRMQQAILGVVRHVLTTVGGGLVSGGLLNSDELTQAIGAVLTLVGIAWSVISKRATTEA